MPKEAVAAQDQDLPAQDQAPHTQDPHLQGVVQEAIQVSATDHTEVDTTTLV